MNITGRARSNTTETDFLSDSSDDFSDAFSDFCESREKQVVQSHSMEQKVIPSKVDKKNIKHGDKKDKKQIPKQKNKKKRPPKEKISVEAKIVCYHDKLNKIQNKITETLNFFSKLNIQEVDVYNQLAMIKQHQIQLEWFLEILQSELETKQSDVIGLKQECEKQTLLIKKLGQDYLKIKNEFLILQNEQQVLGQRLTKGQTVISNMTRHKADLKKDITIAKMQNKNTHQHIESSMSNSQGDLSKPPVLPKPRKKQNNLLQSPPSTKGNNTANFPLASKTDTKSHASFGEDNFTNKSKASIKRWLEDQYVKKEDTASREQSLEDQVDDGNKYKRKKTFEYDPFDSSNLFSENDNDLFNDSSVFFKDDELKKDLNKQKTQVGKNIAPKETSLQNQNQNIYDSFLFPPIPESTLDNSRSVEMKLMQDFFDNKPCDDENAGQSKPLKTHLELDLSSHSVSTDDAFSSPKISESDDYGSFSPRTPKLNFGIGEKKMKTKSQIKRDVKAMTNFPLPPSHPKNKRNKKKSPALQSVAVQQTIPEDENIYENTPVYENQTLQNTSHQEKVKTPEQETGENIYENFQGKTSPKRKNFKRNLSTQSDGVIYMNAPLYKNQANNFSTSDEENLTPDSIKEKLSYHASFVRVTKAKKQDPSLMSWSDTENDVPDKCMKKMFIYTAKNDPWKTSETNNSEKKSVFLEKQLLTFQNSFRRDKFDFESCITIKRKQRLGQSRYRQRTWNKQDKQQPQNKSKEKVPPPKPIRRSKVQAEIYSD